MKHLVEWFIHEPLTDRCHCYLSCDDDYHTWYIVDIVVNGEIDIDAGINYTKTFHLTRQGRVMIGEDYEVEH